MQEKDQNLKNNIV